MTRFIRSFTLALAGAALFSACADSPAEPGPRLAAGEPLANVGGAEILERINEIEESELVGFVPCANGGEGELVFFAGTLNIRGQVLRDANGGLHLRYHLNPQNFSGVGAATGDTYRASGGITQNEFTGTDLPIVATFHEILQFVATGSGTRFRGDFVGKLVVSADGTVELDELEFTDVCK